MSDDLNRKRPPSPFSQLPGSQRLRVDNSPSNMLPTFHQVACSNQHVTDSHAVSADPHALVASVSTVALPLIEHTVVAPYRPPQLRDASSPKPSLRVACTGCGRLYVQGAGLTRHQKACSAFRQVSSLLVMSDSPHPAPVSPPDSSWAWARSIDVLSSLHLGLPRPRLYAHIPFALRQEVQRALCVPLSRLANDPYDLAAWHAFLLFPVWCLQLPPRGGEAGHRETRTRLRRFFSGDWANLQDEFYLRCKALAAKRELGPPTKECSIDARLRRCLLLGQAGELSRAARALVPSTPAPPSSHTVSALQRLHPQFGDELPLFVEDFQPDTDLQLGQSHFVNALFRSPHISAGGPSGWVFEHFRDCLSPDDSASGFAFLFQVCNFIALGHIPSSIATILSAARLIALDKPSGGVRPIAVGEVLYRLVARTISFQLRDVFQAHFSPLQFGCATSGGCDIVVHALRATLDAHPDWVVIQVDVSNAFNSVFRSAIFQELRDAGEPFLSLIPFVRTFYARDAPLYYSHNTSSGDVTIIPSATGTRQGDPLGGPLFALAHLRALRSTSASFPSCLLPSIADDTHIVGPSKDVIPAFLHFKEQLSMLGLSVNLSKCTAWCPQGLPEDFPIPEGFLTPEHGIKALGIPIGASTHVNYVVQQVLQQQVQNSDLLPKLGNVQVAFAILTRCFARRPGYLIRCVPPSPDILQLLHNFDNSLIQVLGGLLASDSLRHSNSPFLKRQIFLPASSAGLGLSSTAQIAPAAFLGSWALVASALISQFQQNDHPLLFESVAHVETGSLGFQRSLRDARDLLPAVVRSHMPPFESLITYSKPRLQQSLSEHLHSYLFTQLIRDSPSDVVRARLLSCAGTGAGAWLLARPTLSHLRMSSELFLAAIRIRLGLPHPSLVGIIKCSCGHAMDSLGIHLLRCPSGGDRISSHDTIRDVVAAIAFESGFHVIREQLHVLPVTSSQSSRRRVDLVLSKDGVRTLGDVVIADPTRPDLLQRSSTTQGIAANQVALDKERDYRDRYPSEAFIPFAIEIFGCLHQKFDKFLSTCADLYVKKHSSLPLSIIVSYFRQRVSIALQRAQAQALIRRGNAAGAAASRHPTQLPVHSTLPSDVFHAVGLD